MLGKCAAKPLRNAPERFRLKRVLSPDAKITRRDRMRFKLLIGSAALAAALPLAANAQGVVGGAALGAADDTLCIRRKRERRCKSRTSNQKLEPHSVSPRYFCVRRQNSLQAETFRCVPQRFRCAFAEHFRKCFNGL